MLDLSLGFEAVASAVVQEFGYLVIATNKPAKVGHIFDPSTHAEKEAHMTQPLRVVAVATYEEYVRQVFFVREESMVEFSKDDFFYKVETD